ncbi:MAG: YbjQ family protein [Actinomycetota bacterium]
MILVTTDAIPGYTITQALGVAQGNTVRTKHIGRDIGAGLKSIVGGELTGYTEMMTEARSEAAARMTAEAQAMGANAIINVRYATADVMGAGAEILAYGTAVVASPSA